MISKLKKLFNSSSSYFHQDNETLATGRRNLVKYLGIKGYERDEITLYKKAYDYFVANPAEYDGATMTEDLCDLPGLDLDAMLHDWIYIVYNASGNYRYIWMADKLMREEMKRKGKSTINAGLRFVLLALKTLLFYPAYSYLFKKRRMSLDDKSAFEWIYRILINKNPERWYKEYRGELTWVSIIILTLILIF